VKDRIFDRILIKETEGDYDLLNGLTGIFIEINMFSRLSTEVMDEFEMEESPTKFEVENLLGLKIKLREEEGFEFF